MGKFGLGKKDDGGEDPNRLALFGSKSKKKAPARSDNPYAQPILPPDPYTQAKANVYGANSTKSGKVNPTAANGTYSGDGKSEADSRGAGDNRYGEAGSATDRYGSSSTGYGGGGYGADRYGTQSGYGADRYGTTGGTSASQGTSTSRYGAGGYGGLGGADSNDAETEENRNALFDGAKDRLQRKPQQQQPPSNGTYGQPPPYEPGSEAGGYDNSSSQGYGPTYQDRQLTAEEEEDEDVSATKQEIRVMKREDVSSTRNALRIAQQAEESGRDTLARLGVQGEHLHNTEKNLNLAHNQNRLAEDKARALKTLNKSMFAVHVANPFTAGARREARDKAVIERHLDERDAREAARHAEYASQQRMQTSFKQLQPGTAGYEQQKGKNLAERAKYQFEADSEDDEMENEIDGNLQALGGAAGRLNALARATGREVDEQNQLLERIGDQVRFHYHFAGSWRYMC